jgi:Ser/Thr protein kinase RdoA (MazF antagonist)
VEDGENFWRMTNYIPSVTYDVVTNLNLIRNAGKAFGEFQMLLSDFAPDALYETIPNFHNTRARFEKLAESVAADPKGRVAEVKEELEWLWQVQDQACTLTDMLGRGELPLRVTHNDTKLNNVLLDRDTRKSLCVLDLDTVMPGLSLYDFGDSIRFGAATAAEDEKDLDKMTMDLNLFQVYTKGFMEACPTLTDKEVEMLPMGALLMTLECGLRFLADYIDGDHYFRIAYPEQNLDRARTQLKLVADMQNKWEVMNRIVAETARQVRA